MSPGDAQAWQAFHAFLERARSLVDGCVPVAIVFVPSHDVAGQEGVTDLDVDGGVRVLWPAQLSVSARGKILAQLAATETTESTVIEG